MNHDSWERLGEQPQPSWYLDPLVARQKREVHLDLVRRHLGKHKPKAILKTDLFEEAFGNDYFLPDLAAPCQYIYGMDESSSTTRAAAKRFGEGVGHVAVTDARQTGWKSASFQLVISTSTLDHFATRAEFLDSLRELYRVLEADGLLILTLDNPWNPLYLPLHLLSRAGLAPFFLGYTPSMPTLKADLRSLGFQLEAEDWLIHNPRLLSTAVFVSLRRVFGVRADGIISLLLRVFASLGTLPTRPISACFQAVVARKPGALATDR